MGKIKFALFALMIINMIVALLSFNLEKPISGITLAISLTIILIVFFIVHFKSQVYKTYAEAHMSKYILLVRVICTIILLFLFIFGTLRKLTDIVFYMASVAVIGNLGILMLSEIAKKDKLKS